MRPSFLVASCGSGALSGSMRWIVSGLRMAAGDAPRWRHLGSSEPTGPLAKGSGEVALESGFGPEVRRALEAKGHRLTESPGGFGGYQAILIDLDGRRGWFFDVVLWPQEVYFVTGALILAAFGLFFATSLFGRVWCGFTCPQTVWTDLFMLVERLIEGYRNQRMRLDHAPMSVGKALRKVTKHAAWLVIAAATGGAWVFYYVDAPTTLVKILRGQASLEATS